MSGKRKPGRPRTVTAVCPIQGRLARPPAENLAQYVCMQNPRRMQNICATFKQFGAPEVHILFYSDVLVFAGSASRKPHSKCPPTSLWIELRTSELSGYYCKENGRVSISRTNLDALVKKITTNHETLAILVQHADVNKSVAFEIAQNHGTKSARWTYNQVAEELVRLPTRPFIPEALDSDDESSEGESAGEDESRSDDESHSEDESSEESSEEDSDEGEVDLLEPCPGRDEPPVEYSVSWSTDIPVLKSIAREIKSSTMLDVVQFSATAGERALTYNIQTPRRDHYGVSSIAEKQCELKVRPGCILRNSYLANHVAAITELVPNDKDEVHRARFFMHETHPMVIELALVGDAPADPENLLDRVRAVMHVELVDV